MAEFQRPLVRPGDGSKHRRRRSVRTRLVGGSDPAKQRRAVSRQCLFRKKCTQMARDRAGDRTLRWETGNRAPGNSARLDATRVLFSPLQCFRFDDGEEDRRCIDLLADQLVKAPALALYGAGPLLAALARLRPDVIGTTRTLIMDPEDAAIE